MALRDQPYIPFFVQDFMTDEKLIECSSSATGVYIRVMCLMHKSDEYGTILLKQKDKQTVKQIKNFALKLVKHLPYTVEVIESGLKELIIEEVLVLAEDKLLQKRMVKDNDISIKRSEAGKKGGKQTQFAKANTQTKPEANSEYEIEIKTIIEYLNNYAEKKFRKTDATCGFIRGRLGEGYSVDDLKKVIRIKTDEWKDTDQAKYIRPETLFGATKFQGYINQDEGTQKNTVTNHNETDDEALRNAGLK